VPPAQRTDWIENRPSRGFRGLDLGELWYYRELVMFLALRDLKVRYKQAVFGVGWALLQPLAGVVVFTVVFRRVAGVASDGIPYPLFAFTNLAVWSYLSSSVIKATQSLVTNSALVTKVYFPRFLAPLAALLPGLVDLIVALLFLAILIPVYGGDPGWPVLTLPLWMIAVVTVALGIGLWLATLNVRYRDVNQVISLVVQLWLFMSPVAYPASEVPKQWQYIYALNPMTGVLEGFRWALLGGPWPGDIALLSIVVNVLVVSSGILYFQRVERRFADVI
jgi:ABC-type polysaccharide/polyol phosphate export permease